MVMDYIEGGDLFEGIVSSDAGHLTEQFAAQILHRSCLAVSHLHNCGIAHCDIKPENLLLLKDRRCAGAGPRPLQHHSHRPPVLEYPPGHQRIPQRDARTLANPIARRAYSSTRVVPLFDIQKGTEGY